MHTTASKNNFQKLTEAAIVVISLLCFAFFIALFLSVRCEPDDMIISLECRQDGFWQAFVNRYHYYSFRPTYTLFSFLTVGYSNNTSLYPTSIFLFYILLYALFIFSVYKLLKELFSLKIETIPQKLLLACFSNLVITALYFFTTERIEIFGWVSASGIHLLPVVFVFFSGWIILKKQTNKTDYLLLVISAAIIAGGAEHIATSIILSGVVIGCMFYINRKKQNNVVAENKTVRIKIIFFIIVLIVFLIVCVSNPGVWLHYNEVQNDTLQNQHHINLAETMHLFFKPYKVVALLFLVIAFLLFQSVFVPTINKSNIKLKYFFIVTAFTLVVTMVLSVFAYNTVSVGRIWFLFDVTLFVLIAAIIIKYFNSIVHRTITYSVIIVVTIFLILFDIRHIPALHTFAVEHDKTICFLQQQTDTVIVLPNFPKADLTNQVALSANPNNDVNQLFCRFYNIKAKVSVKN